MSEPIWSVYAQGQFPPVEVVSHAQEAAVDPIAEVLPTTDVAVTCYHNESLSQKRLTFARVVGEVTLASAGATGVVHSIFPSVSVHFPRHHEDLIVSSSAGNIADNPLLAISTFGIFAASIAITHAAGTLIAKPELIRDTIESTKAGLIKNSKAFTQWVRTILPQKPGIARRAYDPQMDTDSALQA